MAGVEVQTIWQGLNGIRYQTEDKKTWFEFNENGEKVQNFEVLDVDTHFEAITDVFLINREKGIIVKLDRINMRTANVDKYFSEESDELPKKWTIMTKGFWDSPIVTRE